MKNKFITGIKEIIWLVFLLFLPALIFISPFFIGYYTGNFWYILLLTITWLPALVLAKFVTFLHDN
jgi:hypothetical protein